MTKLDSSEARKTAIAAISSGLPQRASALSFVNSSDPWKSFVIPVEMAPGQMAFTRMFFDPSSRAACCVMPTTPCFDTVYERPPAPPTRPATDAVFTMEPFPRFTMSGTTFWENIATALQLMAWTRSQVSQFASISPDMSRIPALLHRMSTPPNASTAVLMAASRSALFETSARTATPLPPPAVSSLTVSCAESPA